MDTTSITFAGEKQASVEENDNPFVGLRPYEADESFLFFGRDQQITELLQKLHTTHFIGVVGSSGCGKSSLVKAGLIPKLKAGFLTEERDHWLIASMRPGGNPLQFLAESIFSALNSSEHKSDNTENPENVLKKIYEKGVHGIIEIVYPIFENSRSNLLLLVDQFEELFTTKITEERQNNESIVFVDILLSLAQQRHLPIYIIITMRSDYIGNCNKFYGLPELLNDGQYLVPRLKRAQLKEVIEFPIKLYGQKISKRLLDQLLNDCDKDLDQLPVLQHCLMRTYQFWSDKRKTNIIDLEHYDAVGRLDNALSNHANEIYDALTQRQQKIAEILFRCLTDVNADNEPIRRRQKFSELTEVCKSSENVSPADIEEVINEFRISQRSFLTPYKEVITSNTFIDISHESLMRQWDKLKEWMKTEQDSARKYKWLCESVTNKREALRGLDLHDALNWKKTQQPNAAWAMRYSNQYEEVEEYIAKSKKRAGKVKLFNLIFIAAIAMSLLLGLGLVYYYKGVVKITKLSVDLDSARTHAESEKERLDILLNKQKDLTDSLDTLRKDALTQAETEKSLRKISEEQKKLLGEQKLKSDSTVTELTLKGKPFYGKLYNQFGKKIADDAIKFLSPLFFRQFQQLDTIEYHKIQSSIDMALVINEKMKYDPSVSLWMARKIWETNKIPIIDSILTHTLNSHFFYTQKKALPRVSLLTATYTDNKIIGLDQRGSVFEWYNEKTNYTQKIPGINRYTKAKISTTGSLLLTWRTNDTIQLWNLKNINSPKSIVTSINTEIRQVEFSSDDANILLLDSLGNTLELWNIENLSSRLVKLNEDLDEKPLSANFSPDGNFMITISLNGWTIIRDLQKGSVVYQRFPSDTLLKKITSLILSSDWKRALIKDYNDNFIFCEKTNGDSIFFRKNSKGPAQNILNLKTIERDLYQHAFFSDNSEIVSIGLNNIKFFKIYPNCKNIDQCFETIKVPDLSFKKQLGTELLTCKDILTETSQDNLYQAAMFYKEASSEDDSRKICYDKIYQKLSSGNKYKISRDLFLTGTYFQKVQSCQKYVNAGEKLRENSDFDSSAVHLLSNDYGSLSFNQLFIKDFKGATRSASRGIQLDSTNVWIYTNLALGYLLDGQINEAESIYLKYKDSSYVLPNYGKKTFKKGFLGDFEKLENAGIIVPDKKELYEEVIKIKKWLE